MNPEDDVCLCFHVPQRKIVAYLRREDPPVASLISECLGAGTGCGWCIPFLKRLHAQHRAGQLPDLDLEHRAYQEQRLEFHKTGTHPDESG